MGTLLATFVAVGCGSGRVAPPEPGSSRGLVPDLRGVRVMVLPVQRTIGVREDVDPELAFALEERGGGVGWVFPDELAEALARSPALDVPLEALPVGMFLSTEVNRVGDPLYGYLRRAAAIANAQVALIPVAVRRRTEPDGSSVVELVATLLDVRTGRVIWFSVVEGQPGAAGDFRTVASAVDAFASALLWYLDG